MERKGLNCNKHSIKVRFREEVTHLTTSILRGEFGKVLYVSKADAQPANMRGWLKTANTAINTFFAPISHQRTAQFNSTIQFNLEKKVATF